MMDMDPLDAAGPNERLQRVVLALWIERKRESIVLREAFQNNRPRRERPQYQPNRARCHFSELANMFRDTAAEGVNDTKQNTLAAVLNPLGRDGDPERFRRVGLDMAPNQF